ncbi:TM2 domain-containing protein [Candidatus Poriferisocius sp.]|uniref:TM2 domain-containing protein n=1 Tax=Candidatus Poriferisocius sp. TaxID=3101276 RepID=UPI003B02E7DF
MTPRNAELREMASACKDLSDTERLVFEAQYARHRRDPAIATILSVVFNVTGVDRFYLGQVGAGFAKLFTLGGFFIWAFVDLFIIRRITAEQNATAIRDICAHIAEAR